MPPRETRSRKSPRIARRGHTGTSKAVKTSTTERWQEQTQLSSRNVSNADEMTRNGGTGPRHATSPTIARAPATKRKRRHRTRRPRRGRTQKRGLRTKGTKTQRDHTGQTDGPREVARQTSRWADEAPSTETTPIAAGTRTEPTTPQTRHHNTDRQAEFGTLRMERQADMRTESRARKQSSAWEPDRPNMESVCTDETLKESAPTQTNRRR